MESAPYQAPGCIMPGSNGIKVPLFFQDLIRGKELDPNWLIGWDNIKEDILETIQRDGGSLNYLLNEENKETSKVSSKDFEMSNNLEPESRVGASCQFWSSICCSSQKQSRS